MHEVLVNRLGDLSLPRKSVVRLTDRPDMTLDVYRGRKTIIQQQYIYIVLTCINFNLCMRFTLLAVDVTFPVHHLVSISYSILHAIYMASKKMSD